MGQAKGTELLITVWAYLLWLRWGQLCEQTPDQLARGRGGVEKEKGGEETLELPRLALGAGA